MSAFLMMGEIGAVNFNAWLLMSQNFCQEGLKLHIDKDSFLSMRQSFSPNTLALYKGLDGSD